MNDRQDPYAQEPLVYGYDAYGQPVYEPNDPRRVYDQYGQPLQQQGQSGHPGQSGQYGEPGQHGSSIPQQQPYQSYQPEQAYQQSYDPYAAGAQPGYGYDPYGQQSYQQQQYHQTQQPEQQQPRQGQSLQGQPPQEQHLPGQSQQQGRQQEWIPQQAAAPRDEARAESAAEPEAGVPERLRAADKAAGAAGGGGEEYRTEQFSFIEEPDEDSEDVIDWLKFSESRTERRDERKRQGRNRVVVLAVVLALLVAGGVGYLWYAGMLPGTGGGSKAAVASGGAQKRDVIVVHLRETKGGGSSTALLVDNETAGRGTTVLLPNTLAVSPDGTATTLGKAVRDGGTGGTRESLNALLGADIKGSWRLDTPYLENLVELVGGITLDADVTIPGAKKDDPPKVKQGKDRALNGQAAVAYATYRASGEAQTKQLERFGQVMQAVLKKVSTDTGSAVNTVESLAQIPDPSLSEQQLGASLAHLAELAKKGSYDTKLLPVQGDGTLSEKTTESVVKDVLGGTVQKTPADAPPRVSVKNATGKKAAAGSAQVTLVNGGYTFVDGGTQSGGQSASKVTYRDEKRAEQAKEIAKTLGLPAGAVAKGDGAPNADVTVVLGSDYKG
ncbi:LCP family protein [Streptomyces varsoviensis]|uniref:LCP family protein n=1 Tax=Streptomyces varsoviensis TaxID=67373 RepID=UPI0004C63738|nr:LCP family protein [Streptomyces varsoviensis]